MSIFLKDAMEFTKFNTKTTLHHLPAHILINILKRLHLLHRLCLESTCRLFHIFMPYDDVELSFDDEIYRV